MCGRYTNTAAPHDIEQRFGLRLGFSEGTRRYNIAPTEPVIAIVDDGGSHAARPMRWGLVPPWAKPGRPGGYTMINARAETVRAKPAFRKLIATQAGRALLPADGFFEWLRPEDPKQPRLPFHFTVDGGGPFALAGLWTQGWLDGERIESVTILTCPANDVVGRLHDRMPVILPDRATEAAWLDAELDAEAAIGLCVPLAGGRMRAAAANPAVNRTERDRVEGPELLSPPA